MTSNANDYVALAAALEKKSQALELVAGLNRSVYSLEQIRDGITEPGHRARLTRAVSEVSESVGYFTSKLHEAVAEVETLKAAVKS